MKGRMLKIVLSAFMAGATTLSSMPASVFAETANKPKAANSDLHELDHDHACEESHDHCGEHEELFLGDGINVAVLDSGITAYDSAKDVSFVNDAEFNAHGNQMAEILVNEVPEIALYDVRVLDSEGKGKYSDISEAIMWSVDNDADIIVMSFEGYESSTLLADAVKYAAENDVLMIAAAGNDSEKETVYPAAYPTVISVGAMDECGEIYTGLNHGESVDIYVEAIGGTSYAAQYAAADAVRYMQENPDADSTEVRSALTSGKVKEYAGASTSVDGTVYAAACSHKYGNWYHDSSNTNVCTRKCSVCGTKNTTSHSFNGSYNITRNATCKQTGLKEGKCTRCSKVVSTITIPKTSHKYAADSTTYVIKCTVCGAGYSASKSTTFEQYVKASGINYYGLSDANQKKFTKAFLTAKGVDSTLLNISFEMGENGNALTLSNVDDFKKKMEKVSKFKSIPGFEFADNLSAYIGYASVAADAYAFFKVADGSYANIENTLTAFINLSSSIGGCIPFVGDSYSKVIGGLVGPINTLIKNIKNYNDELVNNTLIEGGFITNGYTDLSDYDNYLAAINYFDEMEAMHKYEWCKDLVDHYIYSGMNKDVKELTGKSIEEIKKMAD